jgi:hypothetical protein
MDKNIKYSKVYFIRIFFLSDGYIDVLRLYGHDGGKSHAMHRQIQYKHFDIYVGLTNHHQGTKRGKKHRQNFAK